MATFTRCGVFSRSTFAKDNSILLSALRSAMSSEVTGFSRIDSVVYDSLQSLNSRPEGACQLVPLQNADGGWLRSGNATFSDDKLYSC